MTITDISKAVHAYNNNKSVGKEHSISNNEKSFINLVGSNEQHDNFINDALNGKQSLSKAMLNVLAAETDLNIMVKIRNKAIAAYSEIIKMTI